MKMFEQKTIIIEVEYQDDLDSYFWDDEIAPRFVIELNIKFPEYTVRGCTPLGDYRYSINLEKEI